MNKLLTLVNLELKRDAKFCVMYILGFFFLLLGTNIYHIYSLSRNSIYLDSVTRSYGGVTYGLGILCNNIFIIGLIGLGIIGILIIYTVMIWKRDYTNKNIYTFLMLPDNKFKLYIAKAISVVIMVYSYLFSSIIALFISKNIFNIVLKNKGIMETSFSTDLKLSGIGKILLPINFIDFIMIYGVWLLLAISVIFTVCLIGICFRGSWLITILIILMYPIINLFLIIINSNYTYKILDIYNIGNIGVDFILNLGMIIILNIISYILMNKKLYI